MKFLSSSVIIQHLFNSKIKGAQPKPRPEKRKLQLSLNKTKIGLGHAIAPERRVRFYQIPKVIMAKKGYKNPIKTKIPLIPIFSFVEQIYYTTKSEEYQAV